LTANRGPSASAVELGFDGDQVDALLARGVVEAR
jgi:hypothetical protein